MGVVAEEVVVAVILAVGVATLEVGATLVVGVVILEEVEMDGADKQTIFCQL